MKIMICPLNGPRNISEFTYGGELKNMPDQNTCSDEEWADYVFNKSNIAGVVLEWWMHTPSSYWFLAERHSVTDEIIRTFDAKEIFHQRIVFDGLAESPSEKTTDTTIEKTIEKTAASITAVSIDPSTQTLTGSSTQATSETSAAILTQAAIQTSTEAATATTEHQVNPAAKQGVNA